jgi:maleylacetoacetate isomerase
MMQLYDYWRSSASYRVRIALGLSGEAWDTEIVNLLDASHKSAAHLARNPQGLVPVLETDGECLTQSLAIIEYLDETRQLGLLPADALGRAKVRALAYAIAMEIHPVCNLSVAKWAAEQSGQKITMEAWMQHFITSGLAAYEQMLDGGDYSYGQGVTLADICLAPQIYNARRWGVELTQFPKTMRVLSALETIPAFQAAHPDMSPRE